MQTRGSDTYTFDDNGNTISEVVAGQGNSYTYDSRNRLVEATMGAVTQTMAYDPDRARIQKSVGGVNTNYLIDSNRAYHQVLFESDGLDELSYTFGTDLVGMDTSGASYTYHSDALGSTRLLSDNSGTIADDIRYDAWGDRLSGGDVVENNYLYTGEQFDFGLHKQYLRARFYTPDVGRFSQMDEFVGINNQPITLNKYLYAMGQSPNMIDPSGRISLSRISAASSISGILTTISVSTSALSFYSAATDEDGLTVEEVGLSILIAAAGPAGGKLIKFLNKKQQAKI